MLYHMSKSKVHELLDVLLLALLLDVHHGVHNVPEVGKKFSINFYQNLG